MDKEQEQGYKIDIDFNEVLSQIGDSHAVRGAQYEIISRVAYLIGVPDWVFEKDYEPPKMEIYNQ